MLDPPRLLVLQAILPKCLLAYFGWYPQERIAIISSSREKLAYPNEPLLLYSRYVLTFGSKANHIHGLGVLVA